MKILHIDKNHSILAEMLENAGFENHFDYDANKEEILQKISKYDGLVIRSRFPIDVKFLNAATNLKFIGRVGAGMENIDIKTAQQKGIQLFNAPEGNRDAVAEQVIGMLLTMMNHLKRVDNQVRNGIWLREENRGDELGGKTIGLIGYGNTGKALAKKLSGFNVTVLCVDILENIGDEFATQVELQQLFKEANVLSLHVPLTNLTKGMVNAEFLNQFQNPIYFINTARGKCVLIKDLLFAIENGKVKAAALDVLEYEKSSFESLGKGEQLPVGLQDLLACDKVLLSPHIAGWTYESKIKLATTIAEKVIASFGKKGSKN